jgi:vacuolar-type H+-ATPase subunit I/STV1
MNEEMKTVHKIDELKSKVRNWMTDLGGRVYELSDRTENPMHDMKVEMMIARIKKLEKQIMQLEAKKDKK